MTWILMLALLPALMLICVGQHLFAALYVITLPLWLLYPWIAGAALLLTLFYLATGAYKHG